MTFRRRRPDRQRQVRHEALHSPTTDEFTFGASYALPRNGYLKAIYTNRKISNFIESFTDTTTGNSTATLEGVEVGPFDNIVYRNSNLATRKYQGLTFIGDAAARSPAGASTRTTPSSSRTDGDFEGEARNQPGLASLWGDYPEIYVESRNYPLGRLSGFQRHKVRAWTSYDLDLGRAGVFTPSILYRYDSAPDRQPDRGQRAALGDPEGADPAPPTPRRPPTRRCTSASAGRSTSRARTSSTSG